jgi:hypothetical protein
MPFQQLNFGCVVKVAAAGCGLRLRAATRDTRHPREFAGRVQVGGGSEAALLAAAAGAGVNHVPTNADTPLGVARQT